MLNKLILDVGYWYLATVYTLHPGGLDVANTQACVIADALQRRGVPVFSPIAHTHNIAKEAGTDPLAHDHWMGVDHPFMVAASGLIVAKMEGWDRSRGIGEEVRAFEAMRKRIVYLDPNTFEVDGI